MKKLKTKKGMKHMQVIQKSELFRKLLNDKHIKRIGIK